MKIQDLSRQAAIAGARLTAAAAAAGPRVTAWALRRARERSTYAGLALLATALGHQALAAHIDKVGDALLVLLGSGLVAATTSAHPPAAGGQ